MNAPTKTIDPLLHPRDAAEWLRVSVSWLAKSRLTGDGPRYIKIGRAVRYAESALRQFIKSRMRGSTSEDQDRPSVRKGAPEDPAADP
jgi:predicted DNA-binding transcriptional regulator AlpA